MSISQIVSTLNEERTALQPPISSGLLPGVEWSQVDQQFTLLVSAVNTVQSSMLGFVSSAQPALELIAAAGEVDIALGQLDAVVTAGAKEKQLIDVQSAVVSSSQQYFNALSGSANSAAIDKNAQIARLQASIDSKRSELDAKKKLQLELIPLVIFGAPGLIALGIAIGVLQGDISSLNSQKSALVGQQEQLASAASLLGSIQNSAAAAATTLSSLANGFTILNGDISNIIADLRAAGSESSVPDVVRVLVNAAREQVQTLANDAS